MPRVHKTASEARDHLKDITPKIGERYASATSRADWVEGASSEEAETNFNMKMTEVLANKTRQTRCREAGNAPYHAGCRDKGAKVISGRITASLDKYMTNFAKVYAPVLAVVDALPRRGLDAMANIDNRSKPTVQAWIANRLKK